MSSDDLSTSQATSSLAGIGVGLRMPLAAELLESRPSEIQFLEVHPENYVQRGGRYPAMLRRCRQHWPIVTHGLTMGFGNTEPTSLDYMRTLAGFLDAIETPWHSDHLCFSGAGGVFVHDLLPLPFTSEAAEVASQRLRETKAALRRPIAIENLSYYAHAPEGHRDEAGFLLEVAARADAHILLDVNNVYVNSRNHGFDPYAWIDRIPAERVLQLHIAGHYVRPDGLRIDTHAEPVCEGVYELLGYTLKKLGPKPVLLERDEKFPSFDELMQEVRRLHQLYTAATA